MYLNEVVEDEAIKQIGQGAFKRVGELCRWLYGKRVQFLHKYYIAPSIITRSECEFFGISAPRFAIRKHVYIVDHGRDYVQEEVEPVAFFNLRRLQWLYNAISDEHPHLCEDKLLEEEVVARGLAIADSLIDPEILFPKGQSEFHVLTCDLARAYGLVESKLRGVPFLQQLQIGGGMCAQACIFMALCLQERHAASIGGVSELTAISGDGGHLQVKGLDRQGMIRVLTSDQCGMQAFYECEATGGHPSKKVQAALRGYCMSGVPLICLVDARKVAGLHLPLDKRMKSSIWGKNRVRSNGPHLSPLPPSNVCHALLVVGCSKSLDTDQVFLVNDPAKYPLMTATLNDLNSARHIEFQTDSIPFISVVPRQVALPLLSNYGQPGALRIAEVVQTSPYFSRQTFNVELSHANWPGEWRLVQADRNECPKVLVDLAGSQSAARAVNDLLVLDKKGSDCWYWIQAVQQHRQGASPVCTQLWIWRADVPRGTKNRTMQYFERVAAVFTTESNGPAFVAYARAQDFHS